MRDQLSAKLAGSRIDHVDHYARHTEAGHRARFQRRDPDKGLDR